MKHPELDQRIMASLFPSIYITAKTQKNILPVEKKEFITLENHSEFFSLQADIPPCSIGEFIGVICSSYGAGLYEEQYAPYTQVWFTHEEVAEKCYQRGYEISAVQAREYLKRIYSSGHNLIEYRDNVIIGIREYRRVALLHDSAEIYFGEQAPRIRAEWPPTQEYRTRYNRA